MTNQLSIVTVYSLFEFESFHWTLKIVAILSQAMPQENNINVSNYILFVTNVDVHADNA